VQTLVDKQKMRRNVNIKIRKNKFDFADFSSFEKIFK